MKISTNPKLTSLLAIPELAKNLIWRFTPSQSQARHIFIIGAPRSGTTLLKLILDVHPHLYSPNHETGLFRYKSIFELDLTFDPQNIKTVKEFKKESSNIVEFFDRYALLCLSQSEKKRFIEKTPSHILVLQELLKKFPNSQFIHIFRDGRDAYCSSKIHPHIKQNKNAATYASYWRKCINKRLNLGEIANIYDIKYEELVVQPEYTIKGLMNFLGEEIHPHQLNFNLHSKNKLVSSPPLHFKKLSQDINDTSVARYKQELDESEILEFNKVAFRELQLLGYQV